MGIMLKKNRSYSRLEIKTKIDISFSCQENLVTYGRVTRAVSRILNQLPFFCMPYFGRQGQCLGMKQTDDLRKLFWLTVQ